VGSLAATGAAIVGIGGALAAAIPVAAGLAAALVAIAPAAAVGTTAVLSLAPALGALAIGTFGVGDAISAAFAPAAPAARKAAGAASGYANAQRAVKDATQAAGLANERAARQIEDAERALSDAQKDALKAQEDLNDARQQAARDLEDLNNRVVDAQLDQRGAVLDLQEAEKELAAVRAKGSKASARELAEAELARDRAVQRLKEQRTETTRLGADATEANKAGVSGSDAVRDATDRIALAQRTVGDQTRALKDAQVEAARTAAQGLENIRRAQESFSQSVGGSVGGVDKLQQALSGLSPNAREFVETLIGMKGAFSSLKLEVQDALFEGLAEELRITAKAVFPIFRKGLLDGASALNEMAKGAGAAVRELAEDGTLGKALDSANKGLRNLAELPGLVITAFVRLAAAAGPAFERFTQKVAETSEDVGKSLDEAFSSGRLEDSIDNAIKTTKQLFRIFGDLGSVISSTFKGADTGAKGFLDSVEDLTQKLADAFASPEGQKNIKALSDAGVAFLRLIADSGPAIAATIRGTKALIDGTVFVITSVRNELQKNIDFLNKVNDGLDKGLGAIAAFPGQVASALSGLGRVFSDAVHSAGSSLSGAVRDELRRNRDAIAAFPGRVRDALSGLGRALSDAAHTAGSFLLGAVRDELRRNRDAIAAFPGRAASALSGLGNALLTPARDAGRRLLGAVREGVKDAVDAVDRLPGQARRALGDLSTFLYRAGRSLIQGFIDGITYQAKKIPGVVTGVLSEVKDFFGNSPAKVGPFSGKGWTLHSGEALVRDFSQGVEDSQGAAVRATSGLMAAAATPLMEVSRGTVSRAAVATSTPVQVTLVNEGVLGSRAEVLDWLSTSLDTLKRQGRLSVVGVA
jgi:hypothetical protein